MSQRFVSSLICLLSRSAVFLTHLSFADLYNPYVLLHTDCLLCLPRCISVRVSVANCLSLSHAHGLCISLCLLSQCEERIKRKTKSRQRHCDLFLTLLMTHRVP